MKKICFIAFAMLILNLPAFSQATLVNTKSREYKTSSGIVIQGQTGFMEVSENRNNPASRTIRLKYVHLKSLSDNPATPIIYLEGGDGLSTWEANSPRDLNDRLEYLEVADLIYLDRRGADDNSLGYLWKKAYPTDFFVSEEIANKHYQAMAPKALDKFDKRGFDIRGYNIEEHAKDVNDLMGALGFERYTLFGFSYGSHIGMTVMKLFPDHVERAILVGADAPNQALNFPRYLDEHISIIGTLVERDTIVDMTSAEFRALVDDVMKTLKAQPVTVTVRHPLTRKKLNLSIGDFGLALVLRLDIDDAYDIPVIPRLLYSIKQGDYSMLTWFIQKRMIRALGIPGQGINQQLASGVGPERWAKIEQQAKQSPFGNVVNFPFSAVKDHWIENKLSFDPSIPIQSDIPTLFVTGTLDC
ncbi:MAG: alpha/beta hydrolase, partial [Bacteroidota bacterium]